MRTATGRADSATTIRLWRYVLMVGAVWFVPLAAAAQTWVPTDISVLGGAIFTGEAGEQDVATAVSDSGTVVGYYHYCEDVGGITFCDYHPFVWTGGPGWTDPGTFPANTLPVRAVAWAANSTGEVVGWSETYAGNHAFRWTASGGLVDLDPLGVGSLATGINNVGQIVGTATFSGAPHAFLLSPGSGMLDLGTLGGRSSAAFGINDAGQVVGSSDLASGALHAFKWSAATGMVDLGTFGGPTYDSGALSINNGGEVAGWASNSIDPSNPDEWSRHAAHWTSTGTITDLGTFGGRDSYAFGINDAGLIVGYADLSPGAGSHGFVRKRNGPMEDLGGDKIPKGVNNAGQVVGYTVTSTAGVPYSAHAMIWSGPWKDLVGNYGPSNGIWALRSTSWLQIEKWSPKAMVSGDFDGNGLDDLAIDFSPNSGVWLWMNHATWVPLHDLSPTTMAVGDFDHDGKSDLLLSFAGYGLYAWMNNTTWQFLHPFDVTHLAVGDLDGDGSDDLIADFPGFGIWAFQNNATWIYLHGLDVTTMTTADLDNDGKADLVASFPVYGIYVFRNDTGWTFLHPFPVNVIAAGQLDWGTQADLVIDFGPTYGIWTYCNSATWSPLHTLSSTALAVADFDGDGRDEIAIGFGVAGVWRYSAIAASPWTFVNSSNASALVASRIH